MGRCQMCGRETESSYSFGDHDSLCRKCFKMMVLEDEKDYEDETTDESEVDEE